MGSLSLVILAACALALACLSAAASGSSERHDANLELNNVSRQDSCGIWRTKNYIFDDDTHISTFYLAFGNIFSQHKMLYDLAVPKEKGDKLEGWVACRNRIGAARGWTGGDSEAKRWNAAKQYTRGLTSWIYGLNFADDVDERARRVAQAMYGSINDKGMINRFIPDLRDDACTESFSYWLSDCTTGATEGRLQGIGDSCALLGGRAALRATDCGSNWWLVTNSLTAGALMLNHAAKTYIKM